MRDMSLEQSHQQRRGMLAPALLTSAVVLLVLALWLGMTAIRHDWLGGPEFTLQLGPYRVIALTTGRPECLPLPLQQCFFTFPIPHNPNSLYYVVWVGRVSYMMPPAPDGVVTISSGRRLLQLPIVR